MIHDSNQSGELRDNFPDSAEQSRDRAHADLQRKANDASAGGVASKQPMRDHIMQFFAYEHLPPNLQRVSMPFSVLAESIEREIPRNPERTIALRKLLEAKDAAVRAFLAK